MNYEFPLPARTSPQRVDKDTTIFLMDEDGNVVNLLMPKPQSLTVKGCESRRQAEQAIIELADYLKGRNDG